MWETLNITASLRLPESLSRSQKNALMQTTIESMGLIKVRQTQVRALQPIHSLYAAASYLRGQPVLGLPLAHRRFQKPAEAHSHACASGAPLCLSQRQQTA